MTAYFATGVRMRPASRIDGAGRAKKRPYVLPRKFPLARYLLNHSLPKALNCGVCDQEKRRINVELKPRKGETRITTRQLPTWFRLHSTPSHQEVVCKVIGRSAYSVQAEVVAVAHPTKQLHACRLRFAGGNSRLVKRFAISARTKRLHPCGAPRGLPQNCRGRCQLPITAYSRRGQLKNSAGRKMSRI